VIDATERFSNRVEDYARYRPHYPAAVIGCLRANCQLSETSVIADVGSGTGILTELFLRQGNPVLAVEPNRRMREAGERLLYCYPHFQSIAGRAERTTLRDQSVDFVTAGQAFHWFDRDKAKAEFSPILKPRGWVVLIWNERRAASSPFAEVYENLLREYATDYERVDHRQLTEEIIGEFYGARFGLSSFEHSQRLDFAGLKGRLLSSSYAPDAIHVRHTAMIGELRKIFAAYEMKNEVVLNYETKVYYGRLGSVH
jgi:SAM-dependent methyltransferase